MLSLRASNEGLLSPRVARAQEHDCRPRLFEFFLLHEERNQSRPPRLNEASAIAAESLMNNAGEKGISEGFCLAKSERAVPGGVGAEGACHPTIFLESRLAGAQSSGYNGVVSGEVDTMRHVPAHFDGEKVVLDGPVSIPPQTPLEVVIPDSAEEFQDFSRNEFLASLPSLTRIWANPLDAEYDEL